MISRAYALTLAITLLASSTANAQSDPAAAQALFDEAKRLMAHNRAAEACPKLEESQRLDPGVGTLLNLGECFDAIGKFARAWSTFRDAEAVALREGQNNRASYAKSRAARVEARLVRLTVDVPEDARVAGLEVLRDGELLREPSWGLPIPVDPGAHTIEARAEGFRAFKTEISAAHDPITVRIAPLERLPPPPPIEEPVVTPVIETPPPPIVIDTLPPPPPDAPPTVRNMGLVVGGIGLASAAIGSVFGVLAMTRDADARGAGCDQTTCPTPGGLALSADAKTFAVGADIGFGIGAALVVTGVVLLIIAPRSPSAHAARAFIGGATF